MAVPSHYNIPMKVSEKMIRYVDLQTEYQRMWNKKDKGIPFIIGAIGLIERNLKRYLGRIPGHYNIHNLQRSAILETTQILSMVVSIKLD